MKTPARIISTVVAFVVAVFFLGLLATSFPRGGIYGVLSFLIIVGIPYLVWWATGRMNSGKTQL